MKLTAAVGEQRLAQPTHTALEKTTTTAATVGAVVAPEVMVGAQAESVQAAHSQLAAMPDIDAARVAEIKQALARGEISFDHRKLAGLIVRHHGGRG